MRSRTSDDSSIAVEDTVTMPSDAQLRLHLGELTQEEILVARAAYRYGAFNAPKALPDVEWLAAVIRRVDGAHDMGAAELAEQIVEAIRLSSL